MAKLTTHPIRDFMRANFIAGMFIALPLAITTASLIWLWDLMDGPLSRIFGYTQKAGTFSRIQDALRGSRYEELLPPLMGLMILILAILVLGIITRSIIGRFLFSRAELLMGHVPLVGILYSSLKQLAEAFLGKNSKHKFQSAVLVQFPMKGSWAIGFVTGTAYGPLADNMAFPLRQEAIEKGEPPPDIVTVFVPTTPLPTQGFTLVLPRSETRELPISVPDAIKLVISGGIIAQAEQDGKKG